MEETLRQLQRQASQGDAEAQRKLDEAKLRIGKSPSLNFCKQQWRDALRFQKDNLLNAIGAQLQAYFIKHGQAIQQIEWGVGPDSNFDGCDRWLMEGLSLGAHPTHYGPETISVNEWNHDFDAGKVIRHLDGECHCGHSERFLPCYIDLFYGSDDCSNKNELRHALQDAIQLHQELKNTQMSLLVEAPRFSQIATFKFTQWGLVIDDYDGKFFRSNGREVWREAH